MAFPGTKHGPRRRPYRVHWGKGVETVSAAEWNRARAAGWIVSVKLEDGSFSDRVAQLANGVVAMLRNGVLHLRDLHERALGYIHTSWKAIDAKAKMIRGEHWQKEVERQYSNHQSKPDADVILYRGQFEGPGGVPVRI